MVNSRKNLRPNKTGPASIDVMDTQQTDQTARMNMTIRDLKYGGMYTAVKSSSTLRSCRSASASCNLRRLVSVSLMGCPSSATSTVARKPRTIATLPLAGTRLHPPPFRGSWVFDAFVVLGRVPQPQDELLVPSAQQALRPLVCVQGVPNPMRRLLRPNPGSVSYRS